MNPFAGEMMMAGFRPLSYGKPRPNKNYIKYTDQEICGERHHSWELWNDFYQDDRPLAWGTYIEGVEIGTNIKIQSLDLHHRSIEETKVILDQWFGMIEGARHTEKLNMKNRSATND